MEEERGGACSTYRTSQKLVQNYGRKPEIRKWVVRKDNFKMGHHATRKESADWIHLSLVRAVMNILMPQNSRSVLSSCAGVSFSKILPYGDSSYSQNKKKLAYVKFDIFTAKFQFFVLYAVYLLRWLAPFRMNTPPLFSG
jgi:hypothetical protein